MYTNEQSYTIFKEFSGGIFEVQKRRVLFRIKLKCVETRKRKEKEEHAGLQEVIQIKKQKELKRRKNASS